MTSDKDVLIKLNRKFSSHHGRCHVLPCSVEKSGTTTSVRKYFQIQDADPSNTESFTAAQPVGNIFTETNTDKSDNTTLTSAISDVSTSNSLICSNAQTDTMESTISTAMPDVQPDRQSDKVKETYFRGRKLRGMELSLPHEFIGVVLEEGPLAYESAGGSSLTDSKLTKTWNQVSDFDKLIVWGHELAPDKENDQYITGVTEWTNLAHLIHDPIE